MVFNNKTLLIATSITSIITQRLIWILKPDLLVTVDKYDYITRIGILLLSVSIAFYVHNIYMNKIKENNYQMNFQKINSNLSFDFININENNFDENINNFLSKIGLFFNVDRTYLFLIDYEKNNMTYSHEWCKHGIKKEVEPIKEISLTNFSWFINSLKVDNVVNIEDTDNMPQKAIVEQKYLLKLNVKSMLAVPIEGEENIQGFIGLQSIDDYKKWSQDEIKIGRASCRERV